MELVRKYCSGSPAAFEAMVRHGMQVARKARAIAAASPSLNADPVFLYEASMLHDIGMIQTDAAELGCFGRAPYILHGVLGRELLEKEGLLRHALVCERHVGAGITEHDIRSRNLPLPLRDMTSQTIEEKLICYADKFFSKKKGMFGNEIGLDEIRGQMARYGEASLQRFEELHRIFSS